MTIALSILGVCAAVIITSLTAAYYVDSSKAADRWGAAFALAAIVFFVTSIPTLIVTVGSWHASNVCDRYSVAAERDVRFERFSFWSWDCLVETSEGWLPKEQIIKVED